MNTLLGGLATLNDIQYQRYRIAFKLHKLQKSFLLWHLDIATIQEALHMSGVESKLRNEAVPVSQLLSAVSEVYTCLRQLRPVLGMAEIKEAEELCSSWLQMNYKSSTGGKIDAGSLKITFCLLSGSKSAEKARYLFSVLANSNGAMESTDIAYYCTVTQQLAGTLQEELYARIEGPEKVWRECLVFVRSAEDIEDEEQDGGIKRQWLSQFEFSKLFTTLPGPAFLNWLTLYHRMPAMDRVVHHVRCAVCTRKPLVAFRYQCTQCNNFNLCQMCFLKGRVTGKHTASHQVMEFNSASKGHKSWHHRLLGQNGRAHGGRIWNEPKTPFIFNSPRTSMISVGSGKADEPDSSMQALTDMLINSQQNSSSNGLENGHAHKPTMIRIGSPHTSPKRAQISKPVPQKHPAPPSSSEGRQKKGSLSTNSSGSPDSTSSGGVARFQYETGTVSSANSGEPLSVNHAPSPSPDPHDSPSHGASKVVVHSVPTQKGKSSHQCQQSQEELAEINKRLSMELDILMNDFDFPAGGSGTLPARLPSSSKASYKIYVGPSATLPKSNPPPLRQLQDQEVALERELSNQTNKRDQLAGELEGLISQVQNLHIKSMCLSNGIRTPSPISPLVGPAHSRADSLPAEAYLNSPQSQSPLLNKKVYHRSPHPITLPATTTTIHGSQENLGPSHKYHDPLAEYRPTDLDHLPPMSPGDNTSRVSVAW